MSATVKASNTPYSTSVQYLLGLVSGKLTRMALVDLFTAKSVETVSDITGPGIYRASLEPNLPDGSSMRYCVILCLRAGTDLYLLAMTHVGTSACGFLNNGHDFLGWHMLT